MMLYYCPNASQTYSRDVSFSYFREDSTLQTGSPKLVLDSFSAESAFHNSLLAAGQMG